MSAQTKGGWPLNRGKKINDFLMVIVASGIARERVGAHNSVDDGVAQNGGH